jgi:hypothetical protein
MYFYVLSCLLCNVAEISPSAESYLNGELKTSDLDLWLESQSLALNQTNTAMAVRTDRGEVLTSDISMMEQDVWECV